MYGIKTVEGNFQDAGQARYAIIVSRFNSLIVERLLEGAIDTLRRHGVQEDQVAIIRIPGAYELPLATQSVARTGRYDAIIALGCVIRGATPHFDYVAGEATKGIAQVSLNEDVPIAFGLLTTDSIEQAIERAGTKAGNKGVDAAMTAMEMVSLLRQIQASD